MTDAIGLAILQFLWQGLLLVVVLVALRSIFRSPAVRYAISIGTLGLMTVAFVATVWVEWSAVALAEPALQGERPARMMMGNSQSGSWLRLLAMVWMAGAGVLALRHLMGWAWVAAKVRKATTPLQGEWLEAALRLQRQMGVRAIRVLRADWIQSPSVYGVIRPVLLVPVSTLSGLTPSQIEAIVAHELAHVLRHDFLLNVLQSVAETLLFFHPAVWWLSRVIRADRELCADALAVRHTGGAAALAEALIVLEERRAMLIMPAASSHPVAERVRRLLQEEVPRRSSGGTALAVMLSIVMAGGTLLYAESSELWGPYLKWLTQDVVYIIDEAEAQAFRRLKSDAERDEFVAQFWKRRDPTPDTPENEYKSEHYRRISYSNELFREDSVPGWRTDRGRVYIRVGPPDEIEAHPVEGRELWMYRASPHGVPMILLFLNGKQK